jgi:hypothetical protein
MCIKPLVQRRWSVTTQQHKCCRSNSSCEKMDGLLRASGCAATSCHAPVSRKQQRSCHPRPEAWNFGLVCVGGRKHGGGMSARHSIVAPTGQSLASPAAGMHVGGRPHAEWKVPSAPETPARAHVAFEGSGSREYCAERAGQAVGGGRGNGGRGCSANVLLLPA